MKLQLLVRTQLHTWHMQKQYAPLIWWVLVFLTLSHTQANTHTQSSKVLVVSFLQNQQGSGHCVWKRSGGWRQGESVWLGIDSVWD